MENLKKFNRPATPGNANLVLKNLSFRGSYLGFNFEENVLSFRFSSMFNLKFAKGMIKCHLTERLRVPFKIDKFPEGVIIVSFLEDVDEEKAVIAFEDLDCYFNGVSNFRLLAEISLFSLGSDWKNPEFVRATMNQIMNLNS